MKIMRKKIGVGLALFAVLGGVSFMVHASVDMPGTLHSLHSVSADSAPPVLQVLSDGKIQLAARMMVRRSGRFRGRRGVKQLSGAGGANGRSRMGGARRHINFGGYGVSKPTSPVTNNLPVRQQTKGSGAQGRNYGQQAIPAQTMKRSYKRRGTVRNRRMRSHRHRHR